MSPTDIAWRVDLADQAALGRGTTQNTPQRVLRIQGRGRRPDQSLGKELAKTGVLINVIAPAVIDTPMNAATAPDVLAHITSLIPMGGSATPPRSRRRATY